MDLAYLIRILLKRKWIILGAGIIAAAVAWFLTRNEQKNYKSTTRLSTGFAVQPDIKVTDNNFSIFEADVKFNNAITTMTSPSVITLLSYNLMLHDLDSSHPFRSLKPDQKETHFYKNLDLKKARQVFREKLETMTVLTSYKPYEKDLLEFLAMHGYDYKSINAYLNIYQVPRTDYLQIDCITENPELSAFIINNLYKEFIRYSRDVKSTRSQESIDTLKNIMDKKKQELDEKNRLLRGEPDASDAASQNMSKLDIIADLEKSLTNERSAQTEAYYSLRKVNQRLANLGTSGSSTTSSDNSNNNAELIIARKAMNDAYTEYIRTNDPAQLTRYNQLKEVYKQKSNSLGTPDRPAETGNRAELQNQKNDLEIDIQASDAKIRTIEGRIAMMKGSVSSTSSRGAAVETLMEEVKLAQREYLEAQQKYNNAIDIGSTSVTNFKQIQVAQPAIDPEPSKRKMMIGMAGTIAVISCILVIILLTYLDSTVKTPGIFSKVVALKMISMVNFMNLKNRNLQDIVAGVQVDEDDKDKKRSNVFRESIRKLRYEVETSGKKIFLVTSTKKGQGKTTLIQALAYSLSLSKKKVLIIDTNFCNNDLTVQLGADPVLENISNRDDDSMLNQIQSMSKNVAGQGSIFAIGSQGGDYTPSEILPKENLLKYLRTLTNDFDYIVLEGPPLNDFSDSKELVQYVDGVIAIFSATHVIKQVDKESIQFFRDLNGKFTGSVLNMVNPENVNTI